jgi:hypothetical protein
MSKSKHLACDDYVLSKDGAWFTIRGFAVRVYGTDEGVVVDIYADGREYNDAIASTYAHDSELEEE